MTHDDVQCGPTSSCENMEKISFRQHMRDMKYNIMLREALQKGIFLKMLTISVKTATII